MTCMLLPSRKKTNPKSLMLPAMFCAYFIRTSCFDLPDNPSCHVTQLHYTDIIERALSLVLMIFAVIKITTA